MPTESVPAPSPKSRGSYSARRLIVITAMLVALLGVLLAAILSIGYQEALRQAMVNQRNISIAFAAQTLSVTQGIDYAMVQTERAYRRSPRQARIDYFDDPRTAQNHVIGIHLFDRDGKLVASATPQYASRPALLAAEIRAPRPQSSSRLSIGISGVDPATGRGIIEFSRLIVDDEGRPIGSILAQVDSERFERIYTLLDLGPGGSVTLFHRNGTMLVRGPPFATGIGRSFAHTHLFTHALPVASQGNIDTRSPIDGVHRIYGYDAVSNYPLVIITGMNKDDALQEWFVMLWAAVAFLVVASTALAFLGRRIMRDWSRQSTLIGRLEMSERRAERSADYRDTILNAVGAPIWVLDRELRLVMWNGAFRQFAGAIGRELAGMPEKELLDPERAAERERRYQAVLEGLGSSEAVAEMRNGAGETRMVIQLTSRLNDPDGEPQLVSVLTDITERHRAEEDLAYLANFDALTGLPNQTQFRRMLEAAVASARQRGGCLGTFVVSLERAHEITDLLGHELGDAAIVQIAEAFSALPKAVVVARIKSAEFAVAVEDGAGCGGIEEFGVALLRRLSEPITVSGRDFYLAPVVGVSLFPQDGGTAEELYRRAESARNRARDDGGEAIKFFSPRSHFDLDQRLTVEAQLRRAVEREELRVVYQPKVDIATGRITGFEALLRWRNAQLGDVPPLTFIPIAERTGLIVPIGSWVLEHVCAQIQSWQMDAGAVKVSVNLAPRQFHQHDLLPMIESHVRRYAIPAGSLELEITESALMSREEEVDQLMHGMRRLGIELSIDDFGTGYSSLAYLKRFPVQRLKIDRAFVRDLGEDGDSAAIAQTIINLARGLKLTVVAEGVENEQQLAMLREMSCDEYQGYLFSKPVEASEVLALLEANR